MIGTLAKVGKWIYVRRAGITTCVAVTSGVAAVIHAGVKSTKNTPKILDEHKEKLAEVKSSFKPKEELTKEEKKVYDKEILKVYLGTTGKLCKNYAVTTGLVAVSAGCSIYSYKTMRNKNAKLEEACAVLSAAYTGVCKKFDSYRDYVVDNYGEEADFKAMNAVAGSFDVKEGKRKETYSVQNSQLDDITFVFDNRWKEFREYDADNNIMMVNLIMRTMQDKLDRNAVDGITINQIIKGFGEEVRDTFVTGWDLIGYLPGDQVEYEVDYDHAYWMDNKYGDDIPAPPITIRLKNPTYVASAMKPNDPFAKVAEDTYAGYLYNLQMDIEERLQEIAPEKINHGDDVEVA